MSEDLRSLNVYPAFHNFTAGDSATTEILLPSAATQISLGSTSKSIFVCRNGARRRRYEYARGSVLPSSQSEHDIIA